VIRYSSGPGRWILAAAVLGSGLAMIDATIVNVALPTIGRDLQVGFTGLQWTVNAYSLTLAALLLLGGSLGDRFGRRRVFVVGVAWFAVASLLCGLAPNGAFLIAARALQGIGGALLTPGSLAIIETAFVPEDRSAAVGAWSGLGGVAGAVGPILGGYLVQAFSWRLAFLINPPIAAFVVWVASRHVPESRSQDTGHRLDVAGAALVAIGLGLVVYALTQGPRDGWTASEIGTLLVGVLTLAAFVAVEMRSPSPMLPLGLFRSRQFTVTNLVTFVVYAAFGASFFLLPIQLQRVVGFSPVAAGAALTPVTVVMLFLSARAGRLAQRIGPRLPMALGPILAGAGFTLYVRIGPGSTYIADVLPGALVMALGLALTVAPLTATVLASAGEENAGIASAVSNQVARTAGLISVAVLPAAVGISQAGIGNVAAFSNGFHEAVLICAGLCLAGGLLAAAGIRNPAITPEPFYNCPVGGPPLRLDVATAHASEGPDATRLSAP
jgi:EmrB/QacA subfamily drug resistance transporter